MLDKVSEMALKHEHLFMISMHRTQETAHGLTRVLHDFAELVERRLGAIPKRPWLLHGSKGIVQHALPNPREYLEVKLENGPGSVDA